MATKENNKNEKLSFLDAQEIAKCFCGIESDDDTDIENAVYEKFDIDMDTFHNLASLFYERMKIGVSPLTETPFIGFINKDGDMWLAKKEMLSMFIASIIQWLAGDKMKPTVRGFSREITDMDGKPEFLIIIRNLAFKDKNKHKANLKLADKYCLDNICPNCGDYSKCKKNKIGNCLPTYSEHSAYIHALELSDKNKEE